MSKPKTKDRKNKTLHLPREIVEELERCPNASDVVSDILIEHCDQIGLLTIENKRNLIREEVREFMQTELRKMMRNVLEIVLEEFSGRNKDE